ncbi:MAG: L,D-transpeptidase family protein [Bacteroidota bacterium]
MRSVYSTLFLLLILLGSGFTHNTFKEEQLRYPRVRQAYADKEQELKTLLTQNGIRMEEIQLYLRGFKHERELEVWAKNRDDQRFQLLKTYEMCRTSGALGPKRKQGDGQIPEGYYHLSHFNPSSNFYLSLKVNYPNRSDQILGQRGNLGGDIFLHGACVTIGCIPITDDKIKELYLLCVEARNNGQSTIPITLFPANLNNDVYATLIADQPNPKVKDLWTDLKAGYDYFNRHQTLPNISFLANGRHRVQ